MRSIEINIYLWSPYIFIYTCTHTQTLVHIHENEKKRTFHGVLGVSKNIIWDITTWELTHQRVVTLEQLGRWRISMLRPTVTNLSLIAFLSSSKNEAQI